MPETTPEALLDYLREHGKRYSPQFLREHLVSSGYDPVQVDAAMALDQAERRSGLGGMARAGCAAFAVSIPVALLNLGLLIKFVSLANANVNPYRTTGTQVTAGFLHWLAVLVAELVLGLSLLLAGWLAREESPGFNALGRALGGGLVLGSALVGSVSLLLLGLCAGYINGVR